MQPKQGKDRKPLNAKVLPKMDTSLVHWSPQARLPILSDSSDSWTCPSCGLKNIVNLPLVNTVETLKGEVASLLISNLAIAHLMKTSNLALLKKTTSPLSMKL